MALPVRIVIVFLFISLYSSICAQGIFRSFTGKGDTNYVASYLDHLTSRVYTSIKSAGISLTDNRIGQEIVYHPNESVILGVGANYGILGLNIGFNFPFINQDDHKYGKTDYLDLQTHIYLKPLTLDLYMQFYKGYHQVDPNDWYTDWPTYDTLPKRPDIRSFSAGFNGQYIFNHRKFSYRAPFLQNEWQKKSAGSFLAGVNIFFVDIGGDSSLIPLTGGDTTFFDGVHFSQYRFFNAGVIAGYAHTFVVKQHFFLTLSLTGGLSGGGSWLYTSQDNELDRSGFTAAGNITGRAAIGYNSKRFFIGLTYLGIFVRNQSPIPETVLGYETSMFRFNIVYRFRFKNDYRLLSRPK